MVGVRLSVSVRFRRAVCSALPIRAGGVKAKENE